VADGSAPTLAEPVGTTGLDAPHNIRQATSESGIKTAHTALCMTTPPAERGGRSDAIQEL
jgi:hypothetical protein